MAGAIGPRHLISNTVQRPESIFTPCAPTVLRRQAPPKPAKPAQRLKPNQTGTQDRRKAPYDVTSKTVPMTSSSTYVSFRKRSWLMRLASLPPTTVASTMSGMQHNTMIHTSCVKCP